MKTISRYWKVIVAAIGLAATVATALGLHYPWVPVVVAVATAFGVYQVPNHPKTAGLPGAPPVKG